MDSLSTFMQSAVEDVFFFGVMLIITLAIVVTVHEFGHYIAARLCGVHVQKFAFGFGKELIGFGGKNLSTRWSIGVFPIGGFVQLFGDVDVNDPVVWDHKNKCKRKLSEQELKVSFCTKPIWQRIFIVAAGPAINIALTLFIFIVVFTTYGQRSNPLTINAIALNSAAHEAGVEIGDTLINMDGKKVRRLEDIYDFTWYENPAQPHEYKILRDDKILSKTITARRIEYTSRKGVEKKHGQTGMVRIVAIMLKNISSVGYVTLNDQPDRARAILLKQMDKKIHVGIEFKGETKEKIDPFIMLIPSSLNSHLNDPNHKYYDRVFLEDPDDQFFVRLGLLEASSRALFWIKKIVIDSYKLMSVAYKGKTDEPVIGGISKISQHTAYAVQAGFYDYIMFIGGFSLMIAFINILPIPALDGGFLVFLFYEAITGKPVSPRIQSISIIIGLVLLIGIMIFANVSDLISMFSHIDS